jgi:hypothetical protein
MAIKAACYLKVSIILRKIYYTFNHTCMKKLFFIVLLFSLPCLLIAQTFNKKFSTTTKLTMTKTPAINNATGYGYFSSYDATDRKLTIYRLTLAGVYVNHIVLTSQNFSDHDIICTQDDGLLLAYHDRDNLYVVHFLSNLTLDWAKQIPIGSVPTPQGGIFADNSVAIARHNDANNEEHYYITCIAPSKYLKEAGPDDIAFNVLDILEGPTLIWNRTYYPNSTNRDATHIALWADYISSIAIFDQGGVAKIGLSGVHLSKGDVHNEVVPFYMGLTMSTLGIELAPRMSNIGNFIPFAPKLIYNPTTGNLGSVMTIQDQTPVNYMAFLEVGNSTNPGQGTAGLHPVDGGRYLIEDQTYGNSISVRSDGDFVLGDVITDTSFTYPGLMHISSATPYGSLGSESYSHLAQHGLVGNHVTVENDDNYQLALRDPGADFRFLQVLRTDANLATCGWFDATPEVVNLDPVNHRHDYHQDHEETWEDFTPEFERVEKDEYTCSDLNPFVKALQPVAVGDLNAKASVFPTLLSGSETLTCKVELPEASDIAILIYDSFGRLLYNMHQSMAAGISSIDLPAHVLANGINIVKITRQNQVLSVTKITSTN